MNTPISKTRSKKSKQRDKEDNKRRRVIHFWTPRNVLIGILFWLTALTIVYLGGNLQYSMLLPGQQAPATVVSSADFACIDIPQTALDRQQAASEVPPVFEIDPSSFNAGIRSLDKFFVTLGTVLNSNTVNNTDTDLQRAIGNMLDLMNIPVTAREFMSSISIEKADFAQRVAVNALKTMSTNAIVSELEKQNMFGGLTPQGMISIADAQQQLSEPLSIADLATPETAIDEQIAQITSQQKLPRSFSRILSALISPWVKPNLKYEPILTEKQKEDIRKSVPDAEMTVKAGTTLVEAGERITPAIQEKLRAYDRRLSQLETQKDRVLDILGDGILLLIALFISGGILRITAPKVFSNDSRLFMLLLLYLMSVVPLKAFLYLATTTGFVHQSLLIYLFPVALTTLLASVLLSAPAALVVGIWSTLTGAILLGHSFNLTVLGILVTVVVIRSSHGIHRRSRVFRTGLLTGLAQLIFATAIYVFNQPSFNVLLEQALTGLANGFLCAFLTLLLIPLFEWMFGVTTDIALLELSDMGNPLLQRLAIEAPGTYHHSLMLANIASAAAQEIGANALAVRVCAYFHDIGKLTKPEFFIENSHHRANPHDDLSPTMSTLVVTSHVKEGLTLANRHKLPQIVKDAIQQHHGKTLVTYFYHRARKNEESDSAQDGKTKSASKINEEDFRYPGPYPQTREMAILSLADSVEAASRSIEKPTSSRIENLVNEIVDKKLLDGQLNECNLTLKQLATIKRSFIFSLTNMLHGRVAYPKDESTDNQPAKSAPA